MVLVKTIESLLLIQWWPATNLSWSLLPSFAVFFLAEYLVIRIALHGYLRPGAWLFLWVLVIDLTAAPLSHWGLGIILLQFADQWYLRYPISSLTLVLLVSLVSKFSAYFFLFRHLHARGRLVERVGAMRTACVLVTAQILIVLVWLI